MPGCYLAAHRGIIHLGKDRN